MKQPSNSTKTVTMSYEEYHDDVEAEFKRGCQHVIAILKKINKAMPDLIKKDIESPKKDPTGDHRLDGEFWIDDGIWQIIEDSFELKEEVDQLMVHGHKYLKQVEEITSKAKKATTKKSKEQQLDLGGSDVNK